jgi:guanyl-specific ribonuclease Sa
VRLPGTDLRIYDLNPAYFGSAGRGTGRIVINGEGDMFITTDHYATFHRIDYNMFGVA